ncbi:hypothetical protein BFX80_08675 [Cobetia marina]|nr:hypothetical protein BFX80_08675 [Cobetia marina]
MGLSTSNAGVDAGRLAFDTQGLASLKGAATSGGERQQQALEESARQFEALMLNMMLKQMRSATESSALTGSQQQEMMTAMLDQQLSQQLASVGEGVGLSRILIQQLSSRAGTAGGDSPPETSSSESAHALASGLVAKEVGAAQGGRTRTGCQRWKPKAPTRLAASWRCWRWYRRVGRFRDSMPRYLMELSGRVLSDFHKAIRRHARPLMCRCSTRTSVSNPTTSSGSWRSLRQRRAQPVVKAACRLS